MRLIAALLFLVFSSPAASGEELDTVGLEHTVPDMHRTWLCGTATIDIYVKILRDGANMTRLTIGNPDSIQYDRFRGFPEWQFREIAGPNGYFAWLGAVSCRPY